LSYTLWRDIHRTTGFGHQAMAKTLGAPAALQSNLALTRNKRIILFLKIHRPMWYIDIGIRYLSAIGGERIIEDRVLRKLFLGFIQIHILYHAKLEPIYGMWMLEELEQHGYNMSAGTLYPLLHIMVEEGLLCREERLVDGKVRKYYTTTSLGAEILDEAKKRAQELLKEIED
jgi:PadR family transcriptional regulator PadR